MGRYDKIAVNDSGWKTPTQAYVWNGSSWVDYGADSSYSTSDISVWNGSSWIRMTLNRSDFTTYNASSDKFVNYTGTSTALSVTSGTITVSTRRHHAAWSAYLNGMMQTNTASWWAGTSTNNDGTEDWHEYSWSGGMWIHRIRLRATSSSLVNTTPHTALISFRNASGTWTSESSYSIGSGYTTANVWGAYFTLNAQSSAGYTALKMRYFNNTTYKVATQSTRIGMYDLQTGTITNGTNWI